MGRGIVALTVASVNGTTPCAATPSAVISMGVAPASIWACVIGCEKVHCTNAAGSSAVAVHAAAVALVVDVVLVKLTRVLPVLVKLKPFVQVRTSAAAGRTWRRTRQLPESHTNCAHVCRLQRSSRG